MIRFDFDRLARTKRLVGYGAGLALLGTRATTTLALDYVVDDTPGLAGQSVDGIPILPTARLRAESRGEVFIILFAYKPESILGIASRLNELGFRYGEDYCDCSFLHYESIARRLQNLGFQTSYERFLLARTATLAAAPRNLSAIAGSWLWTELAEHLLPTIAGDVAECGVYDGGNTLVALLVSGALRGRSYHLLDSFSGLPELSDMDTPSRAAEFRDANVARVRARFADWTSVQIHPGYFEHVLPALDVPRFALVYVDCDLYEPALVCCEALYDRLAPGGCMLFHDYWLPSVALPHGATEAFTGVHRAVDEFFAPRGCEVMVFPETTHALVRKG